MCVCFFTSDMSASAAPRACGRVRRVSGHERQSIDQPINVKGKIQAHVFGVCYYSPKSAPAPVSVLSRVKAMHLFPIKRPCNRPLHTLNCTHVDANFDAYLVAFRFKPNGTVSMRFISPYRLIPNLVFRSPPTVARRPYFPSDAPPPHPQLKSRVRVLHAGCGNGFVGFSVQFSGAAALCIFIRRVSTPGSCCEIPENRRRRGACSST